MFNLFKRNKKNIKIICSTDAITINDEKLDFPTNYDRLIELLGPPSRELNRSKNYIFWDKEGILCGCIDKNEILALTFFQKKKYENEYCTKKEFKGQLFLNDDNLTNKEFDNIFLGKVALHRLGSDDKIRYGFSIGMSTSRKFNTNEYK